MYTRYFGLDENPFALSPDPRYLFPSRRHEEALAHLTYGITQGGGFVQLTGEVGTGKTTMIRALLEQLPEHVDVALILYPFLSVREFVAAICTDLRVPGLKEDASLKALIDALNGYLLANHAKGRRTVLIIDEAQKLSREVLEQVRLLTNLETTKNKLLQILLIGQPELNHLLAQRDLRQIAQRITARYDLKPLSREETRDYIAHRLRVAGADRPLFSRAAIYWIHRWSRGTPRLVNVICDRALLGAYARGKAAVSLGTARRAAAEIGVPVHEGRWRVPAIAAAIAVAWVAAIATWQLAPPDFGDGAPVPEARATADPAPIEAAPAPPTLASLLGEPALQTDTDAALAALFSRWELDYHALAGETACERAEQAGLECLLTNGTWNHLRGYNRPAVLELVDAQGDRHHALLAGLDGDRVTLAFGERDVVLPLAEVDRHWFGQALLLWRPPVREAVLRLGMRSPGVVWLRQALAQEAGGEALAFPIDDHFDEELETRVMNFQRRHQLAPDGVVGQQTFVRLPSADPALRAVGAAPEA